MITKSINELKNGDRIKLYKVGDGATPDYEGTEGTVILDLVNPMNPTGGITLSNIKYPEGFTGLRFHQLKFHIHDDFWGYKLIDQDWDMETN